PLLTFLATLAFTVPSGFAQSDEPPAASDAAPARTTIDLQAAIQGEADAAHRYDLLALRADEEGYRAGGELFRAVDVSENIHRRNHEAALRKLGIEPPDVTPADVAVKGTRENLLVPIESEAHEASSMYPAYIRDAEQQGVTDAVRSFTYARD